MSTTPFPRQHDQHTADSADKKAGNPGRRKFLQGSLMMIPTVALTSPVAYGKDLREKPIELEQYQPEYFTQPEWTFLLAACDRLIPAEGEGPGALETNVPIFIDRQMNGKFGKATDWYMKPPFHENVSPLFGYQSALTPAEVYRLGIAAVDGHTHQTFGKIFAQLTNEQKDEILMGLQHESISLEGVSAKQFFDFLLQNTKEGYFADPIYGGNKHMAAWSMIGFPGARASYLEWVDQLDKPYPLGPVSINGDRG